MSALDCTQAKACTMCDGVLVCTRAHGAVHSIAQQCVLNRTRARVCVCEMGLCA
jgi:hypothetical protein